MMYQDELEEAIAVLKAAREGSRASTQLLRDAAAEFSRLIAERDEARRDRDYENRLRLSFAESHLRDMQAAYERGAREMREAAAQLLDARGSGNAKRIRALPIPTGDGGEKTSEEPSAQRAADPVRAHSRQAETPQEPGISKIGNVTKLPVRRPRLMDEEFDARVQVAIDEAKEKTSEAVDGAGLTASSSRQVEARQPLSAVEMESFLQPAIREAEYASVQVVSETAKIPLGAHSEVDSRQTSPAGSPEAGTIHPLVAGLVTVEEHTGVCDVKVGGLTITSRGFMSSANKEADRFRTALSTALKSLVDVVDGAVTYVNEIESYGRSSWDKLRDPVLALYGWQRNERKW